MVDKDWNLILGAFQIMLPGPESFNNNQKLIVVSFMLRLNMLLALELRKLIPNL